MSSPTASSRLSRSLAQALLGLVLAGLLVFMLIPGSGGSVLESSALAQGRADEGLEVTTYYAVQRLRGEVGLTGRDLCAAGCDSVATRGALEGLLGWYQSNKASLYTARNNVLAARKALNQSAGLGEGGSKAKREALAKALAEAKRALAAVHAQAAASAERGLSRGQRARLSAGRANQGVAGALRYVPGLSGTQREAAREALASGQGRAKALASARLNAGQREALASVRAGLKDGALAVSAGEALALPEPAEVREERELERALLEAAAEDTE